MIENTRGKREPIKTRQKLRDVLPLKAPFVMNICPTGKCNFKCYFCPTNSDNITPEQLKYRKEQRINMTMENFEKIVDGLLRLEDQTKVIFLTGNGESLLHPEIVKMVRILKERKVCREVRIITNGALLSPQLNQELIDAGLDELKVSVEALNNEGYKRICKVDFDFDKLVENIEDYYKRSRGTNSTICAKILTDAFEKEDDYTVFYDIFEPITDYQEVRNVEKYWTDFDFEEQKNHEKVAFSEVGYGGSVCSEMFTEYNVQPNGDICACRIDWSGKTVLGNLSKDTVDDIWKSEQRKKLQMLNLEGKRDQIEMCKGCSGGCMAEYISEEDAAVILKRMKGE